MNNEQLKSEPPADDKQPPEATPLPPAASVPAFLAKELSSLRQFIAQQQKQIASIQLQHEQQVDNLAAEAGTAVQNRRHNIAVAEQKIAEIEALPK